MGFAAVVVAAAEVVVLDEGSTFVAEALVVAVAGFEVEVAMRVEVLRRSLSEVR